MSVTAASTMPEALRGIKVIDVDTHLTEPPDLWTAQVPAPSKDRVPYVKRTGAVDQWFYKDTPIGFGGGAAITVIGQNREKYRGTVTLDTYEQVDESTFDAKARLKIMDDLNVWAQVVFPNVAGFGSGSVARAIPEEDRNLCIRLYNDAVAQWASVANGRLRPQALVPFWDIREAAKEVERAHARGLRGVTATSAPEGWGYGLPDYGDLAWDPFWEACSAYDMPISFHIASGPMPDGIGPWKSFGLDPAKMFQGSAATRGTRQMAPIAVSATVGTLLNSRVMINIIYSGLLDRWPKLKFLSIESGLGWIPFFLELAEYQFDEMTYSDRWGLKRRPREYFRDHFYVSWWFEDFGPTKAIEEVGVKNVLFETDFPHPTCLYPDPVAHAAKVLAHLPYADRKAILQDNAAELWQIPAN
ncbi:MAG TPA: amidohydrolase family protein [Candidatus Binatia bacterium]|nr:amidohydrolase family protein [Candidatus Binatia bacterium]